MIAETSAFLPVAGWVRTRGGRPAGARVVVHPKAHCPICGGPPPTKDHQSGDPPLARGSAA
jgi:hypothetical protein